MSPDTLIAPGHVVIGLIARLAADGIPLVSIPGGGRPRRIDHHAGLDRADLDRARAGSIPVLVSNVDGRLVILGFLTTALPAPAAPAHQVITGEESVTITCGKASITLTRDGKVAIRGAYIHSRSSGAHLIQGRPTAIN